MLKTVLKLNLVNRPTKTKELNALSMRDISLSVLRIAVLLFIVIVYLIVFVFNDSTLNGHGGPLFVNCLDTTLISCI